MTRNLQEKRRDMKAALKRRAAAERVYQKARTARRRASRRLSAAVAALAWAEAESRGELALTSKDERKCD
jgi:hypothetical protein